MTQSGHSRNPSREFFKQLMLVTNVDNPYDPSAESVRAWMYSDESWPDQDWDLFIANGRCDDVVLECARDGQCPSQEFALHCLYVIAGEVIYASLDQRRKSAVLKLANRVSGTDSPKLQRWKSDTASLFGGKIELDYDYWFNQMFSKSE